MLDGSCTAPTNTKRSLTFRFLWTSNYLGKRSGCSPCSLSLRQFSSASTALESQCTVAANAKSQKAMRVSLRRLALISRLTARSSQQSLLRLWYKLSVNGLKLRPTSRDIVHWDVPVRLHRCTMAPHPLQFSSRQLSTAFTAFESQSTVAAKMKSKATRSRLHVSLRSLTARSNRYRLYATDFQSIAQHHVATSREIACWGEHVEFHGPTALLK